MSPLMTPPLPRSARCRSEFAGRFREGHVLAANCKRRSGKSFRPGVQIKSGALAGSIGVTIEETLRWLAVRIATSADVKYVAIHEFGGMIPPHQIVPDKAKALAFVIGGKQAFAARVNLPAIRCQSEVHALVA